MKIQILSDLHIDSYVRRDLPVGSIPVTEADIILLAGDISNADMGMTWSIQQAQALETPIAYITGNHEYFGQDIEEFDQTLMAQCQHTPVTFLQKSHMDIDDYRILGCTLWTDFHFCGEPDTVLLETIRTRMCDYNNIYRNGTLITPQAVMDIHYDQRQWLQQALEQAHQEGKKAVVMTHHGISPQSVSARYAGQISNCAFMTDLSQWFDADWAPIVWVHGHTHEAFDYVQGNTRVVVNPRAYPTEVSSTKLQFDWRKVIDLSTLSMSMAD